MSDIVWKTAEFASLSSCTLDELEAVIKQAREAEAAGTWKDFFTDMISPDRWSDDRYPYLMGKRPETEREQVERLELEEENAAHREQWERQQYEALKAKFEKKP